MKSLTSKMRVLVVDGAKAMVLRNDGDAVSPNLKLVWTYEQDSPATHEQGADTPGRTNDSFGRRSAMEQTDWHRLDEAKFVRRVADDMAKDLAAGEFEKLVVVAPPIALGEFRKVVSDRVAKTIVLEIHKDMTKHIVDEIEKLVVKSLYEFSFTG